MDEFEQQLKRQPLRAIPPEWRGEILRAARPQPATQNTQLPWQWLREWLWPAPEAWASLAAIWLLTLILQLASSQTSSVTVAADASVTKPMQELKLAFQERQRLLNEFLEWPVSAPPPEPAPKPRSERRPICAVA